MNIPEREPKTIVEQRAKWRENIPDIHNGAYRKLYDKAINKKSMRAAVNSKCLDCMNYQSREIKICSVVTCPLWSYRPYQDRPQDSDSAP